MSGKHNGAIFWGFWGGLFVVMLIFGHSMAMREKQLACENLRDSDINFFSEK